MKSDLPSWTEARAAARRGGKVATTTTAASVNGDNNSSVAEAEAAAKMVGSAAAAASAAIQDHMSCAAKHNNNNNLLHHHHHHHRGGSQRSGGGGVVSVVVASGGGGGEKGEQQQQKVALPCELLDHMYAHATPSADEQPQVKKLRELLLINLDLVEQQEQQLRDKERQISLLKQERDAFKQKTERAERRFASLKQKEKNNGDHFDDIRNSIGEDGQEKLDGQVVSGSPSIDKSKPVADRRPKRKTACVPSNNTGETKNHEIPNSGCLDLIDGADSIRNDIYLQLNSSSYESPQKDDVIVPSWRLHHVTSCYQLEGTENLDDEVFLKRHQKLEIGEKRRKKWDIQRIREQRHMEKLKRGRSGNKEECSLLDDEVQSFFPNPDDAQFIEVCDTVPVCAFGYPVPHFQPCEFSLPESIVNSEKSDKQEQQKSPSPKRQRTSDGKLES